MAARLQLNALATDQRRIRSQKLYELDHPDIGSFGRQCLLARRLAERGVRFVCVLRSGRTPPLKRSVPTGTVMKIYPVTMVTGDPFLIQSPALLKDLKSRGMLEDTWLFAPPNLDANRPHRAMPQGARS